MNMNVYILGEYKDDGQSGETEELEGSSVLIRVYVCVSFMYVVVEDMSNRLAIRLYI